MRALFLLLLLTNILVLAWSLWIAPASSKAAPAAAADPASIRKVGEPPAPDGSARVIGVAPRTAPASCVSIGPFAEPAAMRRVASRLETLGYHARSRTTTEDVRFGEWVSVADLATPDDARNTVNALRSVNVTDAYVVTDGGPGIVVSVGVFNDSEGARQAAALVRRAGLEPRISDRTRSTEVTWLDVDRTANGGLPELNDLGAAAPGAGPPVEMRACPHAS